MHQRTLRSVILLGLVVSWTFGCAKNPTAPSTVESTRSDVSAIAAPMAAGPASTASPSRFGDRTPGVVFVTSQGLYYDTFVVKDPLPNQGKFQRLTNGQTEFGPGQPGYLGGRWWEDLNANGVQDPGDHYFLCPLLPPGRETP
jgi:hypothetical protein